MGHYKSQILVLSDHIPHCAVHPPAFLENNILCYSITTPKSATISLTSSLLKSCFPSFFCFLLQTTLSTTMFPISHFFGLRAERQHKLFSLHHGLKYTLYSPQLSDLLMRIYKLSGLQYHQWILVRFLARNYVCCDWQPPTREVKAFQTLLYLVCWESYRRKTIRLSGMIYSSCFLSCLIITSLTLIIQS